MTAFPECPNITGMSDKEIEDAYFIYEMNVTIWIAGYGSFYEHEHGGLFARLKNWFTWKK